MMFITFMALISAPSWVDHPPVSSEFVYTVGEGEAPTKEEALQKAWNSALIRLALVEFPELIQINSKSVETLKGSEFERTSIQNFQLISWRGIHELQSFNSPHIAFDSATKTYHVHRLLEWSKTSLNSAQREVGDALAKVKLGEPVTTYKIPTSPEEDQKVEKQINESMIYLAKLNQNLDRDEKRIGSVLSQMKCGIQTGHLVDMLGDADSGEPFYTGFMLTWGTYHVWTSGGHGTRAGMAVREQGRAVSMTDIIAYAPNFGTITSAKRICN